MKFLWRSILSLMTAAMLTASAAQAQVTPTMGEAFAQPTFKEMAQALVMLNGLDITSTGVIDDYAKLFYCNLYRERFKDDFEWHKVRQMIAARFSAKKDYYRVFYEIVGEVKLGRYNFETQDFPFVLKTAFINVGKMSLIDRQTSQNNAAKLGKKNMQILCVDTNTSLYLPSLYQLELAQPLTFDRLKMSTTDAEELLSRMSTMRNQSRKLYVRFRFKILGLSSNKAGAVTKVSNLLQATFRGYLTNIDIFLDPDLTQFVASVPVSSEDGNQIDPSGFSIQDMPGGSKKEDEKKLEDLNNLRQ